MKNITLVFCTVVFFLSIPSFAQGVAEGNWQNGDIIFIKHPKMPMAQATTDKKQFNCAGIILKDPDGHSYVYYMGDVLTKIRVNDFIALGDDKKYSVKWLSETGLVTEDVANTMRTFVTAKLGTPNDTQEDLNSEELYNAEFVWKIYMSALGVKLCEPKQYTASGNAKKDIPTAGYANKLVTVKDLYKSEILE